LGKKRRKVRNSSSGRVYQEQQKECVGKKETFVNCRRCKQKRKTAISTFSGNIQEVEREKEKNFIGCNPIFQGKAKVQGNNTKNMEGGRSISGKKMRRFILGKSPHPTCPVKGGKRGEERIN